MSAPAAPAAEARTSVECVREALGHTFAAERRLRGRGSRVTGELAYGQVRSIVALGRHGGAMTAGELARHSDLNPASVTALLDHLEEANLVRRERSASDRRVCNVSLTDEGWRVHRQKLGNWQARWEERLSQFSDEELATATRVLDAVAAIYDSAYAERG